MQYFVVLDLRNIFVVIRAGFSYFYKQMHRNGAGTNCFCPIVKGRKQKQTTSEEQMKFNKWTLGLAAVGAVSMASAVRADEPKLVPLTTALSSTVISGYVDVAAQYDMGNYGPGAGVPAGTAGTGIGLGN